MSTSSAQPSPPQPIRLAEYRPYPFRLDLVELTFRLAPHSTRVLARLHLTPLSAGSDLRLDGEGLKLISARLDGQPVSPTPDASGLTLPAALLPAAPFLWEAEVEIDPANNLTLDGLYMSNGMYCTQCEAEGFRKITFYPDRPDVMTTFKVRIESELPVLLSNGNPTAAGPGWAEWHDPWPKPSYLFALVAGDLRAVSGGFTTASGREVALNVWVRPGDEDRCDWAIEAIRKSMAWDETAYGREYDLDLFNVVAVDDFNMGAMENKGLNIFNSRAVLASAATASDQDFVRVEAIIAHEYFHNWTGNRITCRDWFQLSLKEGLTVFRDQSFTSDLRGHAVKRIEDVMVLRDRQFREDGGPLAHPVRPESYVEINNFYTSTVYEKGAELIRMLHRLVGPEAYRQALDLYFARHDGQACTIEDWLAVFAETTGRDLTQFKRWYAQAGTPRLTLRESWEAGCLTLEFSQSQPVTPGQDKQPLLIPIAVGLLNPNGDEVLPTTVLEMTEAKQSFRFEGLAARPVVSALRGFSAPVILEQAQDDATAAFLLAHDSDPFNRWEAGRALAKRAMARMILDGAAPSPDWLAAVTRVILDESLDPAFRALVARMPGEDDMAQTLHAAGHVPDPERIHAARQAMGRALAQALAADLPGLIARHTTPAPYSPAPAEVGQRSLKNAALALLSRIDGGVAAAAAYGRADNMTDQTAALACLIETQAPGTAAALAAFEAQWSGDRLVMDKWFSLQVLLAPPEDCAKVAAALCRHPAFDHRSPNRFRAVFGALAGNHAGFHHADGAGYRLLADWLLRLDPVNPQTAARVSTAFETRGRYDADRQGLMREALERLQAAPGLSRDLGEMLTRMLG